MTSCDLKVTSDRVLSFKFELSALDYGFSEVITSSNRPEALFLASGLEPSRTFHRGGATPPPRRKQLSESCHVLLSYVTHARDPPDVVGHGTRSITSSKRLEALFPARGGGGGVGPPPPRRKRLSESFYVLLSQVTRA